MSNKYNSYVLNLTNSLLETQNASAILDQIKKDYTNQNTRAQIVSHIRYHILERLSLPSIELLPEEIKNITTFRELFYYCKKHSITGIIPIWLNEFQLPSRQMKKEQQTDRIFVINDSDFLIQWILGVINQDNTNLFCQIIAIAILTGRRMMEILCSGQFEILEPFILSFTGQLKQRNRENSTSLSLPCFFPAEEVLTLIQSVRNKLKEREEGKGGKGGKKRKREESSDKRFHDYHLKYTKHLNRVLHLEMDNVCLVGDYHFHDLRGIYCLYSYEFCCPRSEEIGNNCPMFTFPKWIQKVLGHQDISTSIHYNRLYQSSAISDALRDYMKSRI